MTARNPGKWLLNCLVNDHYSAGMSAFFNVQKCSGQSETTAPPLEGKTRQYFIAAEETLWNYAPSGLDQFNGGTLTSEDRYALSFNSLGLFILVRLTRWPFS